MTASPFSSGSPLTPHPVDGPGASSGFGSVGDIDGEGAGCEGTADTGEAACASARGWLEKGQRRESSGDFAGAVEYYDRAIAILRGRLAGRSGAEQVTLGRELAIVWMNRGNALQKPGGESALKEALQAYEATIALLKNLPRTDPAMVSLGCAYMNCAAALQKLSRLEEAADSCDRAIEILHDLAAGSDFHAVRMLAAAWLNRGSIAFGQRTDAELENACSYSRKALEWVGTAEKDDFTAVDIALKARQLVCEVCSLKLERRKADAAGSSALGDASDAAEAALQVVLHWERRGFNGFELVGAWFFRFASSLYAEYQPQFLGEFVMEHLRAGGLPTNPFRVAEWRNLAAESLTRARVRLHSLLFSDPKAAEARRWFDALDGLTALETELRGSAVATRGFERLSEEPH